MSCLTKTLILCAGLSAGYYLGNKLINKETETNLYEIIKKNETHYLKSKENNETILLRTINNKVYGGDLEHLIQGAKTLKKETGEKTYE